MEPIDLSEFPVFEVTYRIEDEAVQAIEAVLGIDYTGDKAEDGSQFSSQSWASMCRTGGGFRFIQPAY